MSNNRKAVTLRFKDKDIRIMQQIIRKEFGPIPLDMGIKSILLNIMQAYINQLAKSVESSKGVSGGETDTTGDSSEVQVQDSSSPVLPE